MAGLPPRVRTCIFLSLALISFVIPSSTSTLRAQTLPTASASAQISVFAGATGVETGFHGGRNLAVTAGADIALQRHFGLNPSLEVRGYFPVDNGAVDAQRNLLGGLRFSSTFGRVHPYADILFGRGRINYIVPVPDPQHAFVYVRNSSNVLSPGVGLRLDLTNQFAWMLDAQLQRYNSPVTVSGHIDAAAFTAAVAYRFDFNHHRRSSRH
ncbi:hypothetical protein [Granulicella aggregans]|uniref:hypothetical protein n=1 Tax=Granulicella aggregans TaxID=474949 RepID=UPI0021E028BA|nr:hypothetical protein [Granulicella aggregans]